jgi:hypothetical protein
MHIGRVLDQQPCAGNEIVLVVVKMVMTIEKIQAYAFYPNSKKLRLEVQKGKSERLSEKKGKLP